MSKRFNHYKKLILCFNIGNVHQLISHWLIPLDPSTNLRLCLAPDAIEKSISLHKICALTQLTWRVGTPSIHFDWGSILICNHKQINLYIILVALFLTPFSRLKIATSQGGIFIWSMTISPKISHSLKNSPLSIVLFSLLIRITL